MSGEEFVTVVSVEDAPLVTVVQVQEPPTAIRPTSTEPPIVQEDVRIYRLPGERLGFGLKFQGCPSVSALTIESTSEGSPSARATASWGPLAPGDRILAVDGRPVTGMTRQQVVGCLTESGVVVTLRVRRGPPPVPPRRQVKRRPVGPPPPPRPLPRAPPRLVRIVPKQNSPRPILIEPRHSDTLKSENINKIQINGSQPLYLTMDDDGLSQVDPINFEENLKEKISPLKNLNPKLISLFEHSQPCEINLKTSQNIQCNNELWANGKSRKSVKDKIALFSCDSENDENRSSEMDNDGLYLNEKQSRKVLKKVQTSISVPEKDVTSNKQYLCSKVNISENCGVNNVDVTSEQDQIYLDSKINFSSNDPVEIRRKSETNKNDSSIIDPFEKINPTLKHSNEDVALQHNLPKVDVKSSSLFNSASERRVKMSTYKDKCGSKLRGLIIPNPSRVTSDQQILDLPEIKSSTLISNGNEVSFQNDDDFQNNYQKQDCETLARNLSNKVTVPTGIEWKPKFDNEIPKYSPAFKRKSLSVFEIRTHSTDAHLVNNNNSRLPQLYNNGGNKLDQEQPIKISTDLQTEPPDGERKINSNFQFIDRPNSKSTDKVISQALEETLTSDNYFESCENLSAPSSINSELTVYNYYSLNSNDDTNENREFTDCKLDSLLSHDLCDSGNHSVPSNSSKSKCDSYDESMSSLINEQIQDSEDTSLNLSSDDGHLTEISYKDENDQNETNDDVDGRNFVYSKTYKLEQSNSYQQCEYLSRERKETTNETLQCYESDGKNSTSPYKCKEQPTNHTYEKNIPEMLLYKFNNADKLKQSTPSSRQDDLKTNHDAILRDHISVSEDSVSSFSSPLSDLQKDNHFASITSLASSTSLISHQELCQLIEESNDASIDDSNGSPEISVIVLHRDIAEGSIGITLAGGVDYESKEITVHKVLAGSPADRDGRIKKGNRILSINGKSMKNLTHAESMAVLKTPRHEVVLVVVRSQGELFEENNNVTSSCYPNHSPLSDSSTHTTSSPGNDFNWGPVVTVVISKEGAGLGFSLKGGKDSPSGDQPLTIQKIFTGGCAEKSKQIFAGDELLQVNQYDLKGMTRVEAWTLMKKLPDGDISLKIRHPTQST